MTVIAGVDPAKAYYIKKYCPSIDILGLNVYGSIENAGANLRKLIGISLILFLNGE